MKHLTLICLLVAALCFVGCKKNDPQATETELQGLQEQPVDPGYTDTGAYGSDMDTTDGTDDWSSGSYDTYESGGSDYGTSYADPYPPAGPRTHTVVRGETIWRISGMYYGKSSMANVQKILDANPGIEPTKMPIGIALIIPE